MSRKILSSVLSFIFLFSQCGFAQGAAELNIAAHLGRLQGSFIQDKFRPPHLRYFSYDGLNNNIRILLDKGDLDKGLSPQKANSSYQGTVPDLKDQARTLLSYFLIGIALPDENFWVNLRPDSPDNIITDELAKTDVGKILLEADVQLKKDTAAFTSPQTPEGKLYWDKLYQKAGQLFGNENITIPTLTRPWIVPGEVIVRESKESAYIYKATLKVMLEEDYLTVSGSRLAVHETYSFKDPRLKALNEYSSRLLRELILPKLTKEVNNARRYAALRQVYYSLILSRWFKARFYGKGGLYSWHIDKKDLTGLTSLTPWSKKTYFQEYQKSFKDGEYNLQAPVSGPFGQSIRSYFSGGIEVAKSLNFTPQGAAIPVRAASPVGGFSSKTNILPILTHRDNVVLLTAIPEGNTLAGIEISAAGSPETTSSPVKEPLSFDDKTDYQLIEMLQGVFAYPHQEYFYKQNKNNILTEMEIRANKRLMRLRLLAVQVIMQGVRKTTYTELDLISKLRELANPKPAVSGIDFEAPKRSRYAKMILDGLQWLADVRERRGSSPLEQSDKGSAAASPVASIPQDQVPLMVNTNEIRTIYNISASYEVKHQIVTPHSLISQDGTLEVRAVIDKGKREIKFRASTTNRGDATNNVLVIYVTNNKTNTTWEGILPLDHQSADKWSNKPDNPLSWNLEKFLENIGLQFSLIAVWKPKPTQEESPTAASPVTWLSSDMPFNQAGELIARHVESEEYDDKKDNSVISYIANNLNKPELEPFIKEILYIALAKGLNYHSAYEFVHFLTNAIIGIRGTPEAIEVQYWNASNKIAWGQWFDVTVQEYLVQEVIDHAIKKLVAEVSLVSPAAGTAASPVEGRIERINLSTPNSQVEQTSPDGSFTISVDRGNYDAVAVEVRGRPNIIVHYTLSRNNNKIEGTLRLGDDHYAKDPLGNYAGVKEKLGGEEWTLVAELYPSAASRPSPQDEGTAASPSSAASPASLPIEGKAMSRRLFLGAAGVAAVAPAISAQSKITALKELVIDDNNIYALNELTRRVTTPDTLSEFKEAVVALRVIRRTQNVRPALRATAQRTLNSLQPQLLLDACRKVSKTETYVALPVVFRQLRQLAVEDRNPYALNGFRTLVEEAHPLAFSTLREIKKDNGVAESVRQRASQMLRDLDPKLLITACSDRLRYLAAVEQGAYYQFRELKQLVIEDGNMRALGGLAVLAAEGNREPLELLRAIRDGFYKTVSPAIRNAAKSYLENLQPRERGAFNGAATAASPVGVQIENMNWAFGIIEISEATRIRIQTLLPEALSTNLSMLPPSNTGSIGLGKSDFGTAIIGTYTMKEGEIDHFVVNLDNDKQTVIARPQVTVKFPAASPTEDKDTLLVKIRAYDMEGPTGQKEYTTTVPVPARVIREGKDAIKGYLQGSYGIIDVISVLSNEVSSPLQGQSPLKPGGIDFTKFPTTIQPMGIFTQLKFELLKPKNLAEVNLEKEFKDLRQMVDRGIVPSAERIKEFVAGCYYKQELAPRMEGLLLCLMDILRLEEENCFNSSESLLEALVIVDNQAT